MNPAEVALLKPCLGQRFATRRQNRVPDQFGIKTDVGWAARSLTEQVPLHIAQPRPALGAAAINAKEQEVGHAQKNLRMQTMGRHNAT
jgi:hypothetical protein